MAIFTLAKDEKGNPYKYESKFDLESLVYYCCNKAVYIETGNLYHFDVATYINQMLYLQGCKGKTLNTRALHYILSFNYDEFQEKEKLQEAIKFVAWFNGFYFKEYQHITVLHTDKQGRYDVHCIVNPVNIHDLRIYHCSTKEFQEWLKDIAASLFMMHKIALQSVSYVDENGVMRYGNDFDLYQNKCWF